MSQIFLIDVSLEQALFKMKITPYHALTPGKYNYCSQSILTLYPRAGFPWVKQAFMIGLARPSRRVPSEIRSRRSLNIAKNNKTWLQVYTENGQWKSNSHYKKISIIFIYMDRILEELLSVLFMDLINMHSSLMRVDGMHLHIWIM